MARQNKKGPMPPALQLFAGVYLIYTAWNLRTDVADRPLFLIPIIFFAIAGAGLMAFAAWRMYKGQSAPTANEEEAPKENEE